MRSTQLTPSIASRCASSATPCASETNQFPTKRAILWHWIAEPFRVKATDNPPGKDLAHERGREAAKGYDYSNSNLQDRDLHRLQHKYDDFGRANVERPLP